MNLFFPGLNGTIDIYMEVLRSLCGDTTGKSMVDLGCNHAPHTPWLGFLERQYVDVIRRDLDHSEEQQFFLQEDILSFLRRMSFQRFDVALCLDVIEHLLIPDGKDLLYLMEGTSKKQILFTPTTELFGVVGPENHDPEAHRSLWTPEMFNALGYCCIVFDNYHEIWNSGAFYAFKSENTIEDFERVKEILMKRSWAKNV